MFDLSTEIQLPIALPFLKILFSYNTCSFQSCSDSDMIFYNFNLAMFPGQVFLPQYSEPVEVLPCPSVKVLSHSE